MPTGPPLMVPRWVAPVAGVAMLLTLWIVGGRAGWAGGMVVTPAEAIAPIVRAGTRDLDARATVATMWSAARGLLIGTR